MVIKLEVETTPEGNPQLVLFANQKLPSFTTSKERLLVPAVVGAVTVK